MAVRLIEEFRAQDTRADTGDEAEGLSAREDEVLGLVAQGLINRDVADRLYISENTVKFHSPKSA